MFVLFFRTAKRALHEAILALETSSLTNSGNYKIEIVPFSFPSMQRASRNDNKNFDSPSNPPQLMDGWLVAELYFAIMGLFDFFIIFFLDPWLFILGAGGEGNMWNFELGLEGEEFIDTYKPLYFYANLPNFARSIVRTLFDFQGEV